MLFTKVRLTLVSRYRPAGWILGMGREGEMESERKESGRGKATIRGGEEGNGTKERGCKEGKGKKREEGRGREECCAVVFFS